ncbi:hypothetical protein GCK32_020075 [Trichostrongylus colubriformis]|uniref:Uncharacterized protein n=1 Tax=Trichostrongylus colubriformis TaxID=6319 RepID=A0AAN8IF93_TRICO
MLTRYTYTYPVLYSASELQFCGLDKEHICHKIQHQQHQQGIVRCCGPCQKGAFLQEVYSSSQCSIHQKPQMIFRIQLYVSFMECLLR